MDLLQSETERYAHKKIPGWIARRVQEMLEGVRKQFDTARKPGEGTL